MTVKTAGKIKKSHLTRHKSWISLLNSAQICKKHSVTQVNFHLYHYANNNPVRYTDPDGRDFLMAVKEDIPYWLSHAGLGVPNENGGWSYFEFFDNDNDFDNDSLRIPNTKIDYSRTVLSKEKISFPNEDLRDFLGEDSDYAGCVKYDFKTKEDMLAYLGNRKFHYYIEFESDSGTDKKLYENAISIGKNLEGYDILKNNCNTYVKSVINSIDSENIFARKYNNFMYYSSLPILLFAQMPRGYAFAMWLYHPFKTKWKGIK